MRKSTRPAGARPPDQTGTIRAFRMTVVGALEGLDLIFFDDKDHGCSW